MAFSLSRKKNDDPAGDEKKAPKRKKPTREEREQTKSEWDAYVAKQREANPAIAKKLEAFDDKSTDGGRGRAMWTKRILIGLAVLILICLVFAACAPKKAPTGNYASEDDAGARAFAQNLVKDFYTWDSDDPDERAERMRQYNPDYDGLTGWNGKGAQTITNATALTSDHASGDTYKVVVRADRKDASTPIYAEVNVFANDKGFSPLSLPSLTGTPQLPKPNRPDEDSSDLESDKNVTDAIKDRLAVFFPAWASYEKSSLDAMTRGIKLTPMNSGYSFAGIQDSKITTADDEDKDRNVSVTVNWKDESGNQTTSTYALKMTQDNDDNWLITKVDSAPEENDAMVGKGKGKTDDSDTGSSSSSSASSSPEGGSSSK